MTKSLVCDFCTSGVPVVSYPIKDGVDFWYACRRCDELITNELWNELADRSAHAYRRKNPTTTSPHEVLVAHLLELHAQARKAMSGDRIEIDPGLKTVRVRVVVYEDKIQIGTADLRYYEGQEYVVQVVTPDGIDGQVARKAGLT